MREAKELEEAKVLAEKMKAVPLTIAVKTGEGGKLFGSVSNTDLLKRLRFVAFFRGRVRAIAEHWGCFRKKHRSHH